MINRELKRVQVARKYAMKRTELKSRIFDPSLSLAEQQKAIYEFRSLPRDSSVIRQRRRCCITGRPRGYMRKFGLSRNKLREAAMQGDVPGITKASW